MATSIPVVDFVICHGSFLNADNKYEHKNKNIPGFGSYGDLRIRDRKMYLAPTPYALVEGTEHKRTLILPATHKVGEGLVECGTLVRREAEWVVVAYGFDLRGNTLNTTRVKNPHVGREHEFKAYRHFRGAIKSAGYDERGAGGPEPQRRGGPTRAGG